MGQNSNHNNLFYDQHVFFCVNARKEDHPRGCCASKNGTELRNYMKEKAKAMGLDGVRINASGCLDRCELGPSVVIYPEGVWYTCTTKEDVDQILEIHIRDGERINHLMMPAKSDD